MGEVPTRMILVYGVWTVPWAILIVKCISAARTARLSKRFFQLSVGIAAVLALVLALIAATSPVPPSFAPGDSLAAVRARTAMHLLIMAGIPVAYAVVAMAMLFHRMWAAIQAGEVRTTPGKAVGFLFIPIFNLYWGFQAIWGWSKDYNAYIATRGAGLPQMPEGLFLAYAILALLIQLATPLPVLGLLLVAAASIVMLIMIGYICEAMNALSGIGTQQGGTSSPA